MFSVARKKHNCKSSKFVWSNVNFTAGHKIPANTKAQFHSNNIIALHSIHIHIHILLNFHSFHLTCRGIFLQFSWKILFNIFTKLWTVKHHNHTLNIQQIGYIYGNGVVFVVCSNWFGIHISLITCIVQWQISLKVFQAIKKKKILCS